MSRKPHYFSIGLFIIIATVMALVALIMVSSDALHSPEYFLETYLDESVQGIDIGTPFKFRGVKVGNVSEIKMVSLEYNTGKMYVMIRVALSSKSLLQEPQLLNEKIAEQIDKGLRLKLVPQGITGLSFIEAEFYPNTQSKPLEIDWEPKYSYIPSTPSMMRLVGDSIEQLAGEINSLNLAAIGQNVENVTSNLNVSVQQISAITRSVSLAADEVICDVKRAASDLPTISSNLTLTITQLQSIVLDSDRDIEEALSNIRYITEDTRDLIRMIKRHPGMLLSDPPDRTLNKGSKR